MAKGKEDEEYGEGEWMVEVTEDDFNTLIDYASWAYDQATGAEAKRIEKFLNRMKAMVEPAVMVKCGNCGEHQDSRTMTTITVPNTIVFQRQRKRKTYTIYFCNENCKNVFMAHCAREMAV